MQCFGLSSFARLGVMALVAAGLGLCGCSSAVEVGSCASFCDGFCARMKDCNVGDTSPTCTSSCEQEVTNGASCTPSAANIKNITCEQLTKAIDCANYCVALCAKAAECDSTLDRGACEQGCAATASKCNSASIEPRDCKHISSETECYEAAGKQTATGTNTGSPKTTLCGPGQGGDQGSLCSSASECLNELGCDKTTTTCQPCKSHDDCKTSISTNFCTQEGKCVYADCLVDDDCKDSSLGPLCRVGKCVKCASEADCAGQKCDDLYGCVQCIEDKDCAADSKCDDHKCWKRCDDDSECGEGECFSDHCTKPVGTPCDPKNYGECGGASCINVTAANLTVDGYCTRSCYSSDPPCPTGTSCKDSQCRKP